MQTNLLHEISKYKPDLRLNKNYTENLNANSRCRREKYCLILRKIKFERKVFVLNKVPFYKEITNSINYLSLNR